MSTYVSKSGQNIYDIAVTLYGTVDGIVYLLINNPSLSLDAPIPAGTEIEYDSDYVINKDLVDWFSDNEVVVKNGNHTVEDIDIKTAIQEWAESNNINLSLEEDTAVDTYYDFLSIPKMMFEHTGRVFYFGMRMADNSFAVIDWGDNSTFTYFNETDADKLIDHYYKDDGLHRVIVYGGNSYRSLDLSQINTRCLALQKIYVSDSLLLPTKQGVADKGLFIKNEGQ